MTLAAKKKKDTVFELSMTAIFIALTLVFTMFVNIRLPLAGQGGLVHLGNVPLFVAAAALGKRTAAIAGGVGMALFDVISGWTAWAPFTLAIVACMGLLSGLICEKNTKAWGYALAVAAALAIKIVGYYFAEVILYQSFITPVGSIPGNVIQVAVGGLIAAPIGLTLKKYMTTKHRAA